MEQVVCSDGSGSAMWRLQKSGNETCEGLSLAEGKLRFDGF